MLRLISLKRRWMMPPFTGKRIAGTALDFYARRSRNCVVEHAQLGYLQKVAYFLLWVCWNPPKIKAKHMLYTPYSSCLKYFLNSIRSWQLCITTYITNQSCRACWLNCPQHRFGSKIHQWVCNCRHHCEISVNFFDLLCQHFGFRKSALFPCFEYSWNNIKMYGSIHCWYRIESINQKKEENS